MPIAIIIPRLGWNMEEGVFVGWLKKGGERVEAHDVLFSLESDKSTQDVESLDSGTLWVPPNGPADGDRLPVGAVIGYLLQPGENPPTEPDASARDTPRSLADAPPSEPDASARDESHSLADASGSVENVVPAISPRARRVAAELGIDWARLRGSGRTGRIREKDVRAAALARPAAVAGTADVEVLPITPIRRTIAERMLAGVQSTAPVTLTTTADATNLVNLRNQFRATAAPADVVPGYTDILVKLTAAALAKHPTLNSRWEEDRLLVARGIHIGVAVDTDAGLLVPVIRDVPGLSLRQVTARSRDLSERARRRQLRAEEMQGGTFTLTNLGAFGIDAFTPILNYPQCAILGVGRIRREAVVLGEQIVARDRVTLSLTFDHRIVDGAPAARFLQTLSQCVENPAPWLVS